MKYGRKNIKYFNERRSVFAARAGKFPFNHRSLGEIDQEKRETAWSDFRLATRKLANARDVGASGAIRPEEQPRLASGQNTEGRRVR